MPELAEAFIFSRQLSQLAGVPFVTDSQLELPIILSVEQRLTPGPYKLIVHSPSVLRGDETIEEDLSYATMVRIQHQGKKTWILWKTHDGRVVETETRYGMTGSFSVHRTQHTRLEFQSKEGSFYYNDIRKFGSMIVGALEIAPSATAEQNDQEAFANLRLQRDHVTFKEAMTDQNAVVSGIGNYLINESCFLAMLHPDSECADISFAQFKAFMLVVKEVAKTSVFHGGCTLRDFKDVLGRPGQFQNKLLVYRRERCPKCREKIVEIRREGETTSWICPICQTVKN